MPLLLAELRILLTRSPQRLGQKNVPMPVAQGPRHTAFRFSDSTFLQIHFKFRRFQGSHFLQIIVTSSAGFQLQYSSVLLLSHVNTDQVKISSMKVVFPPRSAVDALQLGLKADELGQVDSVQLNGK
eukprot:3003201-Rhodomonas_salina.1